MAKNTLLIESTFLDIADANKIIGQNSSKVILKIMLIQIIQL